MLPRCRFLPLLLALVALALPRSPARANPPPPDPLAAEYVVPSERQRGTAYGQVRLWSGLGARTNDGLSVDGASTLELMTFANLGIRLSSASTLLRRQAPSSRWLISSVGPSVHLLPYRMIDLSLYVEGGVVRFRDTDTHYAPALSPGFTVELWLSPSWFVRYDGQLSWAIVPDAKAPAVSWLGCLGLGFGI